MAIYKHGKFYHYNFWWNGEHVQRSTRQSNKQVARRLENEHKTQLAVKDQKRKDVLKELNAPYPPGESRYKLSDLGDCTQCEKPFLQKRPIVRDGKKFCGRDCADLWSKNQNPPPLMKDFAQRFIDHIQVRCASKPATIAFYAEKLKHLLDFAPLADARLDEIDEALIDSYVKDRSAAEGRLSESLAPATVNRDLATLRRALRLAHEWRLIDRVPRIRLLAGERNREFILSHKKEAGYLAACPQPLRDIALVILDTGLRVSEALNMEWSQVHLEPAHGARFGYVHVEEGKSRNARRNVPLTDRAKAMLKARSSGKSSYVFPSDTGRPYRVQSVNHIHAKVREALQLPQEFVIYSLRHTYGTRLGEAGADAFTIMRLMGHSTVTVSQRYVHPTPATLERAVEGLQAMNEKAVKKLSEGEKLLESTSDSTSE